MFLYRSAHAKNTNVLYVKCVCDANEEVRRARGKGDVEYLGDTGAFAKSSGEVEGER